MGGGKERLGGLDVTRRREGGWWGSDGMEGGEGWRDWNESGK